MNFDFQELDDLKAAVARLVAGFDDLPSLSTSRRTNTSSNSSDERASMREVLVRVAERLSAETPYHHPLYVGHMQKPPHPVARLAYSLALWLNPNNHSADGGRVSSKMEREAVAALAAMFGWQTHLGHLTSGGTVANFEALWVARELSPGQAIAVSEQAHICHQRASRMLAVPLRKVAVDDRGRMDVGALTALLATGEVSTVVATLGTTALGAVDPLAEISALRERFDFRLHVDAAYGGYFVLASNASSVARRAFDAVSEADSIVVDPHKHGLQPYGCGCVLFRDPAVARFYRQESAPYYVAVACDDDVADGAGPCGTHSTDTTAEGISGGDGVESCGTFEVDANATSIRDGRKRNDRARKLETAEQSSLGESAFECSRSGAAAVALWATHELSPPVPGGEFSDGLERCLRAARGLHAHVEQTPGLVPIAAPELDVVVWAIEAETASKASNLARAFVESAKRQELHLALVKLSRGVCERAGPVKLWDVNAIVCIRACTIKPEHEEWLKEILPRLSHITPAELPRRA